MDVRSKADSDQSDTSDVAQFFLWSLQFYGGEDVFLESLFAPFVYVY